MPGTVLKRRRLVNRGRRRRQMSDKQIRIFGTKKQKAQLKRRLAARRYRNTSYRKVKKQARKLQRAGALAPGSMFQKWRKATGISKTGRRRRRRPNVAEIITVLPAANRGRRRRRNRGTMARAVNRRRRRLTNRRRHNRRPRLFNRRRRSPVLNRRRRRHNRRTLMNPRVVVRYRNRRHNRRHHNRRRNQGIIGGDLAPAIGVIGGAYVTGLVAGYLPSNLTTGALGYLTTGVVAIAQGQIVGKVFKKPQFGKWMTIGGFVVVALKMAADFFPSLNLPFALSSGSGMGLITSSNFYVPQANIPGSMATFVTPAGITAALPVAAAGGKLSGLGQHVMTGGLRTMRRVGRLR